MKNAISKNPIKKRNLIPRRGRASISVNGIEWDTKQWEKNLV